MINRAKGYLVAFATQIFDDYYNINHIPTSGAHSALLSVNVPSVFQTFHGPCDKPPSVVYVVVIFSKAPNKPWM